VKDLEKGTRAASFHQEFVALAMGKNMCRKLLFALGIVAIAVLVACGRQEAPTRSVWFELPEAQDSPFMGEENLIAPRYSPWRTPAPVHDNDYAESTTNDLAEDSGTDAARDNELLQGVPLPAVPQGDVIVYESGFLGVKFEMADLPIFDFEVLNRGAMDVPLLSQQRGGALGEGVTIYIGRSTTRPANWDEEFWGQDEPFSRILRTWQHPAAEGELTTTENGLAVVKYYLDLSLPWTWPQLDGRQAMYIFREDGKNYREGCESAAFFYIFVSAPLQQFEELHPYLLQLLESIRFLDGPQIRYRQTPTAAALAITGANFPLIDGATSARYLTAQLLRTMFYHPSDAGQWEAQRNYVPWRTSRTVPSYRRLIADEVDLIFVPHASDYVLALVEEAGVGLEFFLLTAGVVADENYFAANDATNASYFAVIREDSPADSPERRIVEFLLSEEGQYVVENAGLGRSRADV